MLEAERSYLDSQRRQRLISRRLEVADQIARYSAVLAPLLREEKQLITEIAHSLNEHKYEPPKVERFNPNYGRTESPIDYIPEPPKYSPKGIIRGFKNRVMGGDSHE